MSQVWLLLLPLLLFFWLGQSIQAGDWRTLDLLGSQALRLAPDSHWIPGVKAVTHWGDTYGYLGAGVFAMYLGRRRRDELPIYLLLLAGVLLATPALKQVFQIARPSGVLQTPSYPSGHTLFATCFYGFWSCRLRAWGGPLRWCAALALGPILIGWSRVALGHHWPSDVLGGWLLGWGSVGVCLQLLRSGKAPTPPEEGATPQWCAGVEGARSGAGGLPPG